ncbi:hypothetical protein SMAC4_13918 [Sordaria macrospora]|uniref:uncharacterized protein n=1 Tax=Sordaria macrospora TaxID=5147 RepID=UPI002B30223B|nr:hypothetical protein SMAC4_13918 [Sordaria macrospora]
MSTPSPSGPPKTPPPAIIPVTPLPDSIFVLPPPSTTAQSAKRARTADEEARPAHATTATSAASGPITSFAETLISEALAKAEKNSASPPSPTPVTSAPAAKKASTSSASKGKGPISYAEAAARGTDSTSASRSALNSQSFVNIYRRSNDTSALELLQNWQPTTRTLLAGDFNAKHHSWQPGAETSESATRIVDYVTEHGLDLLTAPGVPTHNCGNTIDLTFSNIPLCSTRIAPEADCGSDHQVCITDIPIQPVEPPRRRLVLREDPEAIKLFAENVSFLMGLVPLLPAGENSPERLDELAEALCNVLTEALQISCRPSRPEKNAKWWNKTCAQASRMFRNYRHNNPNPIPQRIEALRQEFKSVEAITFFGVSV